MVGSGSRMGRPKSAIAGDVWVSGLGQFLYKRIALKKAVWSVPPGPVLPAIIRFTVLTPVSARLLAWGLYAAESLWCTPQSLSSSLVDEAANSGPPSVVIVSGMPNVANVSLSMIARPAAPFDAGATIGHPEYLSTSTTYAEPSW